MLQPEVSCRSARVARFDAHIATNSGFTMCDCLFGSAFGSGRWRQGLLFCEHYTSFALLEGAAVAACAALLLCAAWLLIQTVRCARERRLVYARELGSSKMYISVPAGEHVDVEKPRSPGEVTLR